MPSSSSSELPSFLREELFELVDEWSEQLFGTKEKPEAAAYELARLAAQHAAIEALYSIRIRMGDHTYRYQEDDGTLDYQKAEELAFDGLAALQEYERRVEREACCVFLNVEGWNGLGDRCRAHRAISDLKPATKRPVSPRIKTGSTWRRRDQDTSDAGFYTVVYGGYRVIGRNPRGQSFRCSVGSFLREFEPVDPESVFLSSSEAQAVLPQVCI